MHIERISLKTLTVSILLALGVAALVMSLVAGQHFRGAALTAQAKTLSRVLDVAAHEVIRQLRVDATDFGTALRRQLGLRQTAAAALRDPAQAPGLRAALDTAYREQADGGLPGLAKLRLYDSEFELVAESSQGLSGLDRRAPDLLQRYMGTLGPEAGAKPVSGLWHGPEHALFSVLLPLDVSGSKGYLEVVTDPVPALKAVGVMTQMPLSIRRPAGDGTLYQPEGWQGDTEGQLQVEYSYPAGDGTPALRLVVLEDTADLRANMGQALTSTIIAFVALTAVALLAALWLFNRFLFRPAKHLMADMDRLAAGDVSATVNTRAVKEFHVLAVAFNSMARKLHDTLEHERQMAEDIEGKVDLIREVVDMAAHGDLTGELMVYRDQDVVSDLAGGIQQMLDSLSSLVARIQQSGIQVTSSATEIAATAKQQEATVSEQAATTNQIKATVTEISATSKELVSTMHEVTDVAWKTAERANKGRDSLQRMEETMHRMMEATKSISSKLAVLSEKAGNINTVVTTITKVADQTNLLSLNAAIEAEKAGEYGVGFAVVATEIRRLADQTAVATWDIEQMVKEMQSAVSAGVMGMEKFTEEVREGVENVGSVGSQLGEIIEQVEALIPRFEEVHEGMQSQSLGASQISDAMIQLSETAQQTAESLRQSNGAIQQLNDAATRLQEGASHFKVGE